MSENIEAALRLPFDNTYAQLPTRFYARISRRWSRDPGSSS